MVWPQPTDYHEAIQNPASCFKDSQLGAGTPLLDPLGLPRAILGNFASVYQIVNGSKKYAVRCFLTYHEDQERRYQAISAELTRLRLPFMVDFLFEREGILVKGKWYPMLRMDWVEGSPLTAYIEANLSSPPKLLRLADGFLKTVRELQKNGLGHGDLQHGNILVMQNGSIKLIDYDGMYVPALQGMGSHELGHSNYQHPARDAFNVFGPRMDNFSAWVVTASLLALCFDPFLWFQIHGGDERLLFAKTDFSNPSGSEIFTTMQASPYPKVVEVGQQVLRLLSVPVSQIPPVDTDILSGVDVPTSVGISLDPSRDVLIDTTPGGGQAVLGGTAGAAWVLEHLEPPAPVRFAGSMAFARFIVALCFAAVLFVGWASSNGQFTEDIASAIGGGAMLALVLVLAIDFRRREERRIRKERTGILRERKVKLRSVERRLEEANRKKSAVQEQEKKELQDLAKRVGDATAKESDAVKRVVEETQGVVSRHRQERADTVRREQEALAAALKRIQDAHIDQVLRTRSLDSALIPGVGDGLKRRLRGAGINTAADVSAWRTTYLTSGYRGYTKEVAQLNIRGSWKRIEGIGPERAAYIAGWRESCAASAVGTAPKQISSSQRDQIVQQYAAQRTSLDRHIALAEQQQQQKIAAIRQSANQERQALERQVSALKAKYATQYATMNIEIQRRSRDVMTVKWGVGEAERGMAEYRRITVRRYALAILGRR